jgi:hypothetical protein
MIPFPMYSRASELENLQRLEELERRQRLLSATGGGGQMSALGGMSGGGGGDRSNSMDVSGAAGSGPIIRDERIPGGHIPRPSAAAAADGGGGGGGSATAAAAAAPSKKSSKAAAAANKNSNSNSHNHHHHADAAESGDGGAAAASKNDDGNGEELEKTPGSVIVPCRARGMPMDHNFKVRRTKPKDGICDPRLSLEQNLNTHNLVFIVSTQNRRRTLLSLRRSVMVKNSSVSVLKEDLGYSTLPFPTHICMVRRPNFNFAGSYFACRNAGIKFRYCSHCKVPVAKRNFRKRHKHGGDDIRGGDDSGDEEVANKKGIPAQITAKCEVAHDGLSSQSDNSNGQDKQTELGIQQGLVRSSMRSFEKKSKANNSGVAGDDKITPARQNRWTSLLAKRPATKDGDSMSAWLMEVLAVSDLDTPLKPSEVAASAAAAAGGKAKKGRKNADHHDSDSSNDDAPGNKKRAAKPASANKKKRSAPAAAAPAGAKGDDSEGNEDEAYVSGSFAEWKERKKQKKGKVNPTQEAEV